MLAQTMPEEKRKGRRMLLGLLLFFTLPIALVLLLHLTGYRPGGSSYGTLVSPPQPLALTGLRNLQGQPFTLAGWRDKWSLLYVADGDCAATCQQQVQLLRQVHATLGKDIERARRVLLLPATADRTGLATLQQRYPDLVVLLADAPPQLPGQPHGVFLADPLGNLMMRYPAGYDPQGLRKDLQRLLRYSWVG